MHRKRFIRRHWCLLDRVSYHLIHSPLVSLKIRGKTAIFIPFIGLMRNPSAHEERVQFDFYRLQFDDKNDRGANYLFPRANFHVATVFALGRVLCKSVKTH